MTDLVEFIEARLAEDEWTAQGAARTSGTDWTAVGLQSAYDARMDEHIARHDPARVLREVGAKRKILARHFRASDGSCVGCGYTGDLDEPRVDADERCPELVDLAAVWRDHPDHPDNA